VQGVPKEAMHIICSSWRESTSKQYHVYISRWIEFCSSRSQNPLQADVGPVLHFLTEQYDKYNLGYSALNTARCALSSFLVIPGGHTVGTHPLISRFMKGAFQLRPALPRYTAIWDVKIVLDYLQTLSPNESLRLRDLTFKLTMLLALTSAQRLQTLHNLRLDNMSHSYDCIEFVITDLLKHFRPGKAGMQIKFQAFNLNQNLCVYSILKLYLKVTEKIRGDEKQLLISYKKPHYKVSKDTISRWIKTVMKAAGVDVSIFKPHSTRSAATCAANNNDIPVENILAAAGWSSAKTFQAWYNKPVIKDSNTFASGVLMC